MFDVSDANGDLYPAGVDLFQFGGASRVGDDLSLAMLRDECREAFESAPPLGRHAIGVENIWNTFPEHRSEFVVKVERHNRSIRYQIFCKISDVVSGDSLAGNSVYLPKRNNLSHSLPELFDPIVISGGIENYIDALLDDQYDGPDIDISGKGIIVCQQLSLPDGFRFHGDSIYLSHKSFVRRTNISQLIESQKSAHMPMGFIDMPSEFSGCFIMGSAASENGDRYPKTIVSRIMAFLALYGIEARMLMYLNIRIDGYSYSRLSDQNWHRPYRVIHNGHRSHFSLKEIEAARWFFDVLSTSTEEKYTKARDDYRLLALDTIEDCRNQPVTELQFAQIWMAIERLLPFRHETTANLTLALSAMYPSTDRVQAIGDLKKAYKLRSNIVHGYNFQRDEELYLRTQQAAGIFQSMFPASKNFGIASEFSTYLFEHVISGRANAIC